MLTLDLKRPVSSAVTVFSHELYTWIMNRLTGVVHLQGTVTTNDVFTYDLAGELKTASYGWASPVRNVTYNWDDAGNRTNVVDGGVQTTNNHS